MLLTGLALGALTGVSASAWAQFFPPMAAPPAGPFPPLARPVASAAHPAAPLAHPVMTRAGLRYRYLTTHSTYADVKVTLQGLAQRYPQNAQIFALGPSDSGDVILGLRIGQGPVHNLVVGTHHGNEYGSSEVALATAASLAAAPIAGQTVFVIPVLNLAGFDARRREEPAQGQRRTVDPNRDYPGPCTEGKAFQLKSTAALAQFVDRENIVTAATLHTFYPAVAFPWGFSTHQRSTAYDDLFRSLSAAATVESRYDTGNSAEVIYPADGTFEDYVFVKHGTWSLLFELGHSHSPNDPEVDELVRVNVPGIRRFLEQAPRARAENHEFKGRCDRALRRFDRHVE